MRINDAVQTIIDSSKELRQSAVARGAGVNAGQLSLWLGSGSNLSRSKQGDLVEYLLGWYAALSEERKRKYDDNEEFLKCMRVLEGCVLYRVRKAAQRPLAALEPVSLRHSAFVSHPEDDLIPVAVTGFPQHIALVGGPGTGKSSHLFRFLEKCSGTVCTLLVDCRDLLRQREKNPALDFFPWLNSTCEEQFTHTFSSPLWDPAGMPRWIQQSLLGAGGQLSCVLLLDNLDLLAQEDLRRFGIALHGLSSAIRDEPALRRFSLISAYDEAAANMSAFVGDYAGSYYRMVRTISVHPFTDGAIKPFFQQVLKGEDSLDVGFYAKAAQLTCAGHPRLTGRFASLVREGVVDQAAIMEQMGSFFDAHIAEPIRQKWSADLLQRLAHAFLNGQRQEERLVVRTPTLCSSEIEWLVDSGLFRSAGLQRMAGVAHLQPGAVCRTSWIEAQLERFFRREWPSSS
ncbi:MAG: hypothetical protein H7835_07210 [Magnetococcus sp. XQGC-1]